MGELTASEILHFNKKCAALIGKTKKEVLPNISERMDSNQYWLPLFGIVSVNHLQFHNDWNWIMAIVDFLEKHHGYSFIIDKSTVKVNSNSNNTLLTIYYSDSVGINKKHAVILTIQEYFKNYYD